MLCEKLLLCTYALADGITSNIPGTVPTGALTLVQSITREIINPIIGVLFAAALLYFFWGLLMFIFQADDVSKREEYKQHMLWGLIGLTVMVSAYAILAIGLRTFGVRGDQVPAPVQGELNL